MEGYRNTMIRRGVALRHGYLVARQLGDEKSEESGYEEMKKLLQFTPRPDGVFCQNDSTAMGAMRAILDAGLRIPEDVAVVGCGNVRYADFLRVSLTSIDQQSELIGDNAAKLALALMEKKGDERPRTILLEPKLIVRASSSKNSNGAHASLEA
jgi:LacI family transcriptional regulator